MQTGLVILSTAILAVSVTAVPILDSANSRLQIIEVSENTLEVIFYNEETGIRIRANITSLMLISMANDEVLLSESRPHNTSLLSSVMGTSFLEYATTSETGEQRKVEFIVPESLVDQTKKAVEELKEERLISQLNGDETVTHTIRETNFSGSLHGQNYHCWKAQHMHSATLVSQDVKTKVLLTSTPRPWPCSNNSSIKKTQRTTKKVPRVRHNTETEPVPPSGSSLA